MKKILIRAKNKLHNDRPNIIRTLRISGGFGFCISLSLILGRCLDRYHTVALGTVLLSCAIETVLLSILITVVMTVAATISGMMSEKITMIDTNDKSGDKTSDVLDDILGEESEHEPGNIHPENKISLKYWALCTFILVVSWTIVWLAYYPAVFSYDAEAQLYQVISGNYSTHHPLVHTLLLGMFMKFGFSEQNGIGAGMAMYAACQLLIMSVIGGWTISELIRIRLKRIWIILYGLFLLLFPAHGILAVSTTKDVLFAGFTLLYVLLLRRYLYEEHLHEIEHRDRTSLIKLGLTCVPMLLLRNNAVYAFVLVIVVLALFKWRKEYLQLIVTMVIALVVSWVMLVGLKAITGAESGSPREALAIPIQQMARVKVYHYDELPENLRGDLDILISDEAARLYDEHLADPVKERISMKQPVMFVKTWAKLGGKYPLTYIDAWLLTTQGAWDVLDRSCNRIYGEGSLTGFGYLSTDIRNMPEGFEVYNESKIPALRSWLESIVSDNAFEKIPVARLLFAPALYMWMCVLFLYKSILRRDKRGIVLMLFMGAYYLTILLSPAILVRYMYPYMLLAFVLALPISTDDIEKIIADS